MTAKLKSAAKYQLWEARHSVAVFYFVIFCVIALTAVTRYLLHWNSNLNGLDFATGVFLFVAGICTFSVEFKFYIQNGLSRKLLSQSIALAFAALCLLLPLIDHLITGACGLLFESAGTVAMQLYPGISVLGSYFWEASMLLMMSYAGYFISTAYYRMSKPVKVAVSIGVPALLIFGTPALFGLTLDNEKSFGWYFIEFIKTVSGIGENRPLYGIVTLLVLAAAGALLSHLLSRRAYVK